MTASAWVVNKDRSKVLMVYHNIYHSWSWLGRARGWRNRPVGCCHSRGKEEAGIRHVQPVSKEIFSLESLTVDGHVKRGCYVSSHLHLNVTYLLEADSEEAVAIKADEKKRCGLVSAGRITGKIHRAVVRGACVRKAAGKMKTI